VSSRPAESLALGPLRGLLRDFAEKAIDELVRNGMDEGAARSHVADALEFTGRHVRRGGHEVR
jgi:hypothetical protein